MYTSQGKLTVRAFLADEALPLEGAVVTILGADEENLEFSMLAVTDEDGVAGPIDLPAPEIELSLSSNPKSQPYASYDIIVQKENYYTKRISNAAIFSGIIAVLPINMIPYVSYADGGSYPRGNINTLVTENDMLE